MYLRVSRLKPTKTNSQQAVEQFENMYHISEESLRLFRDHSNAVLQETLPFLAKYHTYIESTSFKTCYSKRIICQSQMGLGRSVSIAKLSKTRKLRITTMYIYSMQCPLSTTSSLRNTSVWLALMCTCVCTANLYFNQTIGQRPGKNRSRPKNTWAHSRPSLAMVRVSHQSQGFSWKPARERRLHKQNCIVVLLFVSFTPLW